MVIEGRNGISDCSAYNSGGIVSVRLINEEYIKQNSSVDLNTLSKYVNIAIKEAQELDLYEILGEEVYSFYMNHIQEIELYPDYKNLLDLYIRPYLMYASIVNLIDITSNKISNSGNKEDQFPPILISSYKSSRDVWMIRLIDKYSECEFYTDDTQSLNPKDRIVNCDLWLI